MCRLYVTKNFKHHISQQNFYVFDLILRFGYRNPIKTYPQKKSNPIIRRASPMKCPKCEFENPDNAKFCIECASPMEFRCPNCNAITPVTGNNCAYICTTYRCSPHHLCQ